VIVLDASVLIAHLDSRDVHHAKAGVLIGEESGSDPLGASSITLAETLVAPARSGRLEDARAALAQLGVSELPLGDDAPARLAQLRADTGRKLPDCCVLLAAEENDGAVASFDSALVAAAASRGLRTLGGGR
jgi:predicted nucleic acid-binding protein